ncbi:MAG TPA: 50S ribosomal protein L4 [Bacteroidales bacterium]|nr:50S ribosomal protein L4 [Bacteroidales bacterium]HSA44256.1 50S ribosomal protein L4 [Bacteroidales bacterium]
MELEVYNIKGEKTARTVVLDDAVFNIEPNDHAIYLDTKQFLANKRQGTHKSKEKWEVNASTKKLKRQKGTGGARAGSAKSPLFVGGGRVFGPQPRIYNFKLNLKLKKLARRSALTYKARENQIMVVEDFSMDTPKTRSFTEILKNLQIGDKKTLLVTVQPGENLLLSVRNLKRARVSRATDLNTYEILHANHLLLLESSVKELEKLCQ